jgi:D-beta-D-heptose 7-phosphate kinase/D-beta-D-heptose 1-phosphate adenosyltransferase
MTSAGARGPLMLWTPLPSRGTMLSQHIPAHRPEAPVATPSELLALLDAAQNKRVLVVGDMCLDSYWSGEMRGLSPEAPVPLVEARTQLQTPGAAGNVAAGLAALGINAAVAGVIGDDADSAALRATYDAAGVDTSGLITQPGRPSTIRTRITVGDARTSERTVLRVDTPPSAPASAEAESALIAAIRVQAATADAIVVVEGPGICTMPVIDTAHAAAKDHAILLVGDVSGQGLFLRGYDAVLPNEREAAAFLGLAAPDSAGLDAAGVSLVRDLGNRIAAITRGPQGISLFTANGREDVPAIERQIFDVTGAGDTTTAAFVAGLLGKGTAREAAELANLAAYVAVGRPGTAVVTALDVRHAAVEVSGAERSGKLRSREELAAIVSAARTAGKRVVFTNGCFDLIHPGHVTYLAQARALGDALIVALNSDVSVQTLKGPTRPILRQDERVMILSALESVSWVTIFDETRITGLLEMLKPDVWAKGGDYTLESLDQGERRMADSLGCEIALIPPVEGISTTDIVHRIEEARRIEQEKKNP